MKRDVIKQLAVGGLAMTAVAGIAVGAAAAANDSPPDTPAAAPLGGPEPATPSLTPSQAGRATPVPAPAVVTQGKRTLPAGAPTRPQEKPLPKDAVKACQMLLQSQHPLKSAKLAVRLDGAPGAVVVLADSNYWAGCSTAYARHNGEGSLREPAKLGKPPATADTFAVANNLIPMQGKEYDYYWAAGQLPAGVAKIAYTFPDGAIEHAVVKGNYWLMQHREAKPWVQGSDPKRPKIKVTLQRPDGSVLKEFRLTWGEQTCAQISHGC